MDDFEKFILEVGGHLGDKYLSEDKTTPIEDLPDAPITYAKILYVKEEGKEAVHIEGDKEEVLSALRKLVASVGEQVGESLKVTLGNPPQYYSTTNIITTVAELKTRTIAIGTQF